MDFPLKKTAIALAIAGMTAGLLLMNLEKIQRSDEYKGAARLFTERSRFFLVSEDVAEQTGAESYKARARNYLDKGWLDASPGEYETIRSVAEPIIEAAKSLYPHTRSWNWEYHLSATEEINADCTAGGKIMVNSGLVRALEFDRDQIAAVVAHEVSHAILEHTRARLSRELLLESAMWVISKSLKMGEIRADAAETSMIKALFNPISRRDEMDADTLGQELMSRAGFDPRAMTSVWLTLKETAHQGNDGYFLNRQIGFISDHPTDDARIRNSKKLAGLAQTMRKPSPTNWLIDKKQLADADLESLQHGVDMFDFGLIEATEIADPIFRAALAQTRFSADEVDKVLSGVRDDEMAEINGFWDTMTHQMLAKAGSWKTIETLHSGWAKWKVANLDGLDLSTAQGRAQVSPYYNPALCEAIWGGQEGAIQAGQAQCLSIVETLHTMFDHEGGRTRFQNALLMKLRKTDPRFAQVTLQNQDGAAK